MSFKDVLLALTSYPAPTPDASIDRAVALIAILGAQATALTFETETKLTHATSVFTDVLVDVPQMLAEERAKSLAHAKHLLEYFKASATRQRVTHDCMLRKGIAFQIPDALVARAKLHDLTIIPQQEGYSVEQWYGEAIIFGSGRPAILLPSPRRSDPSSMLDRITVAWDFRRAAARALADALPLLEKAKHVYVVTVTNEKEIADLPSHAELANHLLKHGIEIRLELVDAKSRSAGAALTDTVNANGSTLLVMGAYENSRIKEFILGGTTKSMLENPPLPVFLSH